VAMPSDPLERFVFFQLLGRVDLHELDLDAAGLVVEEGDPAFGMRVRAILLAGLADAEARPLRLRVLERLVDIVDLVADVVKPLGAALVDPGLAPVLAILVTLYAAHHGLAKGALFLGVGIARHTRATWVVGVLALAALVLAGAPFTSGALAKGLVKPELAGLVAPWGTTLSLALGASTLGTTLLLARFLFLVGSERAAEAAYTTAAALPWLTLMALLLSGPYVLGLPFPSPAASWPVLAGVLLALSLALSRPHLATRLVGRVPPGDLLSPLARAFGRLSRRAFSMGTRVVVVSREVLDRLPIHIASSTLARDDRVERVLVLRPVSGALFLGIAAALLLLAALGRG